MKFRYNRILLAAALAAAFAAAGCGGSDSAKEETKEEAPKEEAKEETKAETPEESAEAVQEAPAPVETFQYEVEGQEYELNFDLTKYIDLDNNDFDFAGLAKDLGYAEKVGDADPALGYKGAAGDNSAEVLFSGIQAAEDEESLSPCGELILSLKSGDASNEIHVFQDDLTASDYTISGGSNSVSYEMIILAAYGMEKGLADSSADPFETTLSKGSDGTYHIGLTELTAEEEAEMEEIPEGEGEEVTEDGE